MFDKSNVIALRKEPQKTSDQTMPQLMRPKLLWTAARAGQKGWRRQRDLRRLLKCDDLPSHRRALGLLLIREARHNEMRLAGRGEHDLRAHILHLIAILAELRGLAEMAAAPLSSAPVNGPGKAIQARP